MRKGCIDKSKHEADEFAVHEEQEVPLK